MGHVARFVCIALSGAVVFRWGAGEAVGLLEVVGGGPSASTEGEESALAQTLCGYAEPPGLSCGRFESCGGQVGYIGKAGRLYVRRGRKMPNLGAIAWERV